MGFLKRLGRSVRAKFLDSVSKDIAALADENGSLRGEIARLRALHTTSDLDVLKERVRQLELLLTEHPKTDSRGLTSIPFPSPAVSIILATWNRANVLADAIGSVREQSFTDWELIIIDDGSTDRTAEIVGGFANDARVHYVQQSHGGISQARNRGLRLAKGSLIAYLDSDNLWYPGFLSAAVTAFASDPEIDCAYGGLVSEAHDGTGNGRILFRPFDRQELVKENFIDLNTFVHRRQLADIHGVFDETLDRLVDWDLILRYTEHKPARRLSTLAARYRIVDQCRITDDAALGVNRFRVRRKWNPIPALSRPMRVLYVLWHYPQLSESYIEAEILCMKRWGVHIEVWSECGVGSPYEPSVPVHRGSLEEAIAACKPDIIHVHWVQFAVGQGAKLQASGLPVTVRAHGFEVTDQGIRQMLELPSLRRAFFFPHQITSFPNEPRLKPMTCAFDTTLFGPEPKKDRHLVVRTSAGLASKDLQLFFEVAKRLPGHQFVLAVVTAKFKEQYIEELINMAKSMQSPAEIMVDVPRDKVAALVKQAGIYLHTATPPDNEGGTPIGMPISITEAMATGAHVLVRELPPLNSYFGSTASIYRDADHATKLIAETASWPESKWKKAWTSSVDYAFDHHADEAVLRPMFEEWCAIFEPRQKALQSTSP
jgi:hypothetical protein